MAPLHQRRPVHVALAVAVRVAALLLLFAAFQALAALDARLNPGGGANIGLGLLLLLAELVAVALWSARDGAGAGRRGDPLGRWLLCWGLVAVVDALLSTAAITGQGLVRGEGWSPEATDALLSDLALLAPGSAVRTAVAAVIGLTTGRAAAQRRATTGGGPVSG